MASQYRPVDEHLTFRPRSLRPPEIPLKSYKRPDLDRRVCCFDCETDPFGYDLEIKPFTCDFFDGENHFEFWGDNCIEQFADYMETRRDERLLIYCHFWGGFDVHFMTDYFDAGTEPLIIGSRIAEASLWGQVWRDSFRIVDTKLATYRKDEFDYSLMLRENRETHKAKIMEYQRHDNEYLFELVTGFVESYGHRITAGNTAINYLRSKQGFQSMIESQDARVRPYFFGGRNQCLESGILEDAWKIFDVNSMYPFVMATVKHPISASIHKGTRLSNDTAFARIKARNRGALPLRGDKGELDFTCPEGEFFASIHEILAALDLGLIDILRVVETLDFLQWADFSNFVIPLYDAKVAAKASGDKLRFIYFKLLLNSAYGKFAQDARRFGESRFGFIDQVPAEGHFHPEENPAGWKLSYQDGRRCVWERHDPERRKTFFNVATGASITGAARAVLMRGLAGAERPIYCDTDSIICRGLSANLDETRLGAWKLEAEGRTMAIAGKKTYALLDATGEEVKKASKGVGLTAAEIFQVARGETVRYRAKVPTFSIYGKPAYLERDIKATA